MSDLKPCPFCGSDDVQVYNSSFVEWKNCWATGPIYENPDDDDDSTDEAIDGWNDRPEKDCLDLQSQLDAAMHKETAMCLDLERERKEVVYLEGLVAEERARLDFVLKMLHCNSEMDPIKCRADIDKYLKGGE